jgi:fructosamine-3-kinase
MEFINSKTVHELYIKKEMTVQEYKAFYANITKVLEELQSNCSKTKKNKNTFFNDRYQMYVSKTLERLSTLAQEQIFFPFFTNDITINKKSYPNLLTILSLVLKKVKKLLLTDDTFTFIHGDLHFSNIMYNPTSQEIKIFDPRGKFGSNQELGDSIYE